MPSVNRSGSNNNSDRRSSSSSSGNHTTKTTTTVATVKFRDLRNDVTGDSEAANRSNSVLQVLVRFYKLRRSDWKEIDGVHVSAECLHSRVAHNGLADQAGL